MARLAAAHRAMTQLYDDKAEETVDWLLAKAMFLCLTCSRQFKYIDPLGGTWILIEIWRPDLVFLGVQQWALILE